MADKIATLPSNLATAGAPYVSPLPGDHIRLCIPAGRLASVLQGGLFTRDWLSQGIFESAQWRELTEQAVDQAREQIGSLLSSLINRKAPVEAETEDKLVYPVLRALGWDHISVQQRMDARSRNDVPDALLFPDAAADAAAAGLEPWQRFRHGAALVEAKRWNRPLDRAAQGDQGVPAAQVMHYLSRADVITQGKMRWGSPRGR